MLFWPYTGSGYIGYVVLACDLERSRLMSRLIVDHVGGGTVVNLEVVIK